MEAGYGPGDYTNAYNLHGDLPARTDDPSCFEVVRLRMDKFHRKHPNCARRDSVALPTRVLDVDSEGQRDPFLETNRFFWDLCHFKPQMAFKPVVQKHNRERAAP